MLKKGSMSLQPFHLAVPACDLAAARRFYGELFGCPEGRSADTWIDFDFFGHKLVVHLADLPGDAGASAVDAKVVPVPHFGVVLEWTAWHELAARLTEAGVVFDIEPDRRFRGLPGEQATLFLRDPAGNALEFKAFKAPTQLFAAER
jgi:extradiol dioxygenase family protein